MLQQQILDIAFLKSLLWMSDRSTEKDSKGGSEGERERENAGLNKLT